MEKNQLLYVIQVAEKENITNAAKELYITQPSLSNQIIKLEEELNIKLFERKKHKIILTEAGKDFVNFAKIIINDFQKLENLMHDYSYLNKGSLKIGILSLFSFLNLPEILFEFKEKFKNIDIQIEEAGSSSLIDKIIKKELDVAFVILTENNLKKLSSELNIMKLRKDQIKVIVPLDHRLAREKEIKLETLISEKFIFSNDNYQFPNILLNYLDYHQIPYKISCRCNQIDTMFSLVSKKFGITFCSEITIKKKLSKKEKDRLKITSIPILPHFERGIYMISSKTINDYPVLKKFNTFIKEKYNINNSSI